MFRTLIRTARSLQVLRAHPVSRSFSVNASTQFHTTRKMADSAQSTPVESSASNTPAPPAQQQQQQKNNKKQNNRTPHPNAANAKPKPVKREVKILMLHGYTQSGPLFRAKTRALEKLLVKSLSPLNLVPTLIYPTAPNRLSVHDIPGYVPSSSSDTELTDSWAWFRREEATWNYRYIGEGFTRLAETIRAVNNGAVVVDGVVTDKKLGQEGGEEPRELKGVVRSEVVDGVIGFSQGGAMAAMLTAALEHLSPSSPSSPGGPRPVTTPSHQPWVQSLRDANKGQPLKFCVSYSGFFALPEELGWMWTPKVKTPTLHFLGSLDTVVEESRSRRLIEACEGPVVVTHPGGHYVPVSKEWVSPLVGFIRGCLEGKAEEKEEDVGSVFD